MLAIYLQFALRYMCLHDLCIGLKLVKNESEQPIRPHLFINPLPSNKQVHIYQIFTAFHLGGGGRGSGGGCPIPWNLLPPPPPLGKCIIKIHY